MVRFDCEIIKRVANELIGTPYVLMGRDESGVDCYGLVLLFFRKLGIRFPIATFNYGTKWYKTENLIEDNIYPFFSDVEFPRACDVALMSLEGSQVCNHMAIFISDREILNVDNIVGVHKLKYYVVKDKVVSIQRLSDDYPDR